MTLGYIISDETIKPEKNFEVIKYSDYDESVHSPALFIGFDKIKTLFGDSISVLDRKIGNDKYWTFTLDEHRSYHDLDTYEFMKYCYNLIIKGVDYYFIDPLLMSEDKTVTTFWLNRHEKMFDRIKTKSGDIITYHKDNMVYIYANKFILGVNTDFYEFMGDDNINILDKIKDISTVFLSGDDIIIEYEDFMYMYEHDYKYIPYLYSIINDG